VLKSLARCILRHVGIEDSVIDPDPAMRDPFEKHVVWPVYPELATRLGVPGSYTFKLYSGKGASTHGTVEIGLEEYIERCFEAYRAFPRDRIDFHRLQDPGYRAVADRAAARSRPSRRPASATTNPYRQLAEYHFWKKVVAEVPPADVDPVVSARFRIGKQARIATAGSCFAQNISRTLTASGFNYYVEESAPVEMSPADAAAANFGVFSARYANIYTARQLRQLLDRALGKFSPAISVWELSNGRYVDPFRPQIDPGGHDDIAKVDDSRHRHLAAVKRMFESLDIFVFTLGLTEAWRDRKDGSVVPIAPGVVGAKVDPERYEFVNFDAAAVEADMVAFIKRLRLINPQAKVILTVSPVPLIATYERRHVLVSTVYSKSVLRVAAENCTKRFPSVDYFPSYEIITGAFNRGAYFEDDLRSVSPVGVEHVMRVFLKHYDRSDESTLPSKPSVVDRAISLSPAEAVSTREGRLQAERSAGREIVCEEELLDA